MGLSLVMLFFSHAKLRVLSSQIAQLVKNPPAMWETLIRFLGQEDPLKKGQATHSSNLAWRIPWTVHGVAKSWTQLSDVHFHFLSEF